LTDSVRTPYWKRIESWFLAAAFLILISTSVVGWLNWKRFSVARKNAEDTRDIQEQAAAVLASVRDAEDAQRGYLLTGVDSYLDPYRRAARSLPDQFHTLRTAAPDQVESLDRLKSLVDQKMAELEESVALRRNSGYDIALRLVLTDQGRESMEKIRALAQEIIETQYKRFSQRMKAAEERASDALVVNTASDIVLSILLLMSAISMHRGSERREELIAALREDEARLLELRRQAEAAEEKVRSILESIGDGFLFFDRAGNVTYCNPEAARILGVAMANMIGKNILYDFPDVSTAEVEARYREAMEQQRPLHFETFLKLRNVWLEVSVYSSPDGFSVFFRDVTARKHFEERSRHAQKLESLGVLAGGIAHDFNNLLTAILGSASLLMDDLPPDSDLRPFAANVISASERAGQLTRQMLAYSGRGRFVVEPMDLSVQVREITNLLEASITAKVELVLDLQTADVMIEADAGQIQQLVMNLVINGAEAIGSTGGQVVVSTRVRELDRQFVQESLAGDNVEPGEFILLEVSDTGHGMDTATLGRIFDPFFTTKFTGRGLGLAAVLGIVRGHRGALTVDSVTGQGTTFKVYLPVSKGQAVAKARQAPLDFRGDATVLVVDDEMFVQDLATSTLERYGYHVLVASNGKEAVEIFKAAANDITLVVLDMTMPVMGGEDTLVQLKKLRPGLRVIASSGYNEIEALRRFGTGIKSFLQKPYRASELAEKVKLTLS
jgi:two-component system, cell cycle sensor histidine kinase and response regulator CckA